MPRLTKSAIDALPTPVGHLSLTWDDKLSGFGVKVLSNGQRKYVLKYRTLGGRAGKQRWLGLGTHGAVTCEQARLLAQRVLAAVATGADPQGDRKALATAPTLSTVWERFEREQLGLRKVSTQRSYKAIWNDRLKPEFGKMRVKDVRRGDVDSFHKKLSSTPYQANRILALLSHLMSMAEAWEWRQQGTNPCKHVTKFKERARQRFLSPIEIAKVRAAATELLADEQITVNAVTILELLLLTGARSSELASAEWAWLDWERQTIDLPDSKTGEKPIYLSDGAITLLRKQHKRSRSQAYIFPGRSAGKHIHNLRKPWRRICEKAGLSGVRVHDLRHTAASLALTAGASLSIVGRLLGHTQVQTTLRYSHLSADPALKAANLIEQAALEPRRAKAASVDD